MAPAILYRSGFSAPAKITFRFSARPPYVDIVAVREPPMSRADAITRALTRSLQRLRESENCMQDYPTTPNPQPSQPGQQDAPTPQPTPSQPAYAAPPPPPYATPGGQQPRNPLSSNRKKLLIGGGIGCGVLLVLCMCMGLLGALASQGNTSASSGNTPAATAAHKAPGTPQPTATPKPKPTATPQPKWVVTHTYKGNGIQKTDTFTVNSDHWRIDWSCDPKAYGFEYNLIADLTPPGDDFGDSVVNVICKTSDPSSTSGETNEYTSGTFFLDVNSEGPWVFKIEEYK